MLAVCAALGIFTAERALQCENEKLLRVDMNTLVTRLEAADISEYTADFANGGVFAVIASDEQVLFSNAPEYRAGATINLHTLGNIGANSNGDFYTVPLLKNGVQFAVLTAKYNPSDYRNYGLAVLAAIVPTLLFAAALVIWLSLRRILKNDVFAPIAKLHSVTACIIRGDLDEPLIYDYDGAIGTLCHDFEIMREQLSESIKREQGLKEKERVLLASISHDLKTPLAAVIGYVDGILLDVVTESDDVKRYAKRIRSKAETLSAMIDDILKHTKAELSELSICPEDVYSEEYFGGITEEFLSDARQKGFKTQCGETPNVLISLDKKRTAQVMQNLIGNSEKYGSENGLIEVNFRLDGRSFIVSVKDNGKGIAAADLPFVFDKFYRGDKARTQNIPGSGLGLSISKYIVEKQGGRIECDSILGTGTEVSFSLPY